MRRTIFGVSIALSILVASAAAEGFCINKKKGAAVEATWTKEVPYFVSDTITDPALLDAIDAAFKAWGEVECSTLRFRKGGSFEIDRVPFQFHRKYAIYVFFFTDAASYPTDAQYVSYTSHGTDINGALSEASIGLNGFAYKWSADGSRGIDIRAEVARIIADVVGLETSNVASSLTRQSPGEGGGKLSTDDIEALQYLYYKDGCALAKVPNSATGCSSGGGGGTSTPAPGPTSLDPGDPTPTPPAASNSCSSAADCSDGRQCAAGKCIAPPPAFGEGGCTAAGSGSHASNPALWLLLLAFLFTVRRRRR